ncbi:unnamed protein product [Cylicocyclus nassatus]|uniref:Ionotropic glutamate receptor C-terminal domain-containing protein n=1 Tax=Cylicocyclus nassatus TaxID=53992 RepID=A0AA36H7P2_CYLNA|nr:unnamed protein product [Cylicocyclus nassatus]
MLLVIIAGFTVSCLLHLFTKLLTKNSSSIFGFFVEFAVAGYFKNSNFDPKEPFCSRILVCAWLLFIFTLTEYYGARLRSVLSLTQYRGALFTNLDEAMDAMEYHGWKMVFEDKDYSPLLYCYGAQCARMRELQKRSLLLYVKNVSLEEVSETDHHFGFGGKSSDRVPHKETVLDDSKRILFVRDRLITPMHQSYAVSK